ncbi:MAG: sugar transporter [Variovorax sp.]|nr:MAG: sugar transporter [Variovorax sp.]
MCGASLLLQGCAVVTTPGFGYADSGQRTSVPLGQYVAGDPDTPPQGVIIPITRELVRAQQVARPRDIAPEVRALFGTAKPYTIGPSDVIGIVVYDHPDLLPSAGAVISQSADPTGISAAPGFIVNAGGEISFPYIGRLKVAGLTEIEASDLVTQRLAPHIRNPQVTIRIQSFRSRRAYVEGEVRVPGMQVFTDVPMTLPQAISRAGGITANGDRTLVLLTRNDTTTRIDLTALEELGINPSKILLQSDDMVTVRNREENKVYVMGESTRPAGLTMNNGRLSLNQALGETGGVDRLTGNTAQIYVIRDNGQGGTALFHLNAGSPAALALADSFALKPRDVVYIDPVPLVQWNRIISMILPSAQVVNIGNAVAQ